MGIVSERVVLLVLSMLLLDLNAEAACPSTPLELQQLIDQALLSYESWEWESFARACEALDAAAICAADPLDVLSVSRVHLVHALAAGVTKDEGTATAHFRSLLATDPTYVLPDSLAAPGSLLQRAFDEARAAEPAETQRVRASALWIDGERSRHMPVDRPFVAQAQGEMGLQTWLVAAQPVPDDLALALGAPLPARTPLLLGASGGAAALLGGAALYLASRAASDLDGAGSLGEGDALLVANHRYVYGGAALCGVGLGLGAAGLSIQLGHARADRASAADPEPAAPEEIAPDGAPEGAP